MKNLVIATITAVTLMFASNAKAQEMTAAEEALGCYSSIIFVYERTNLLTEDDKPRLIEILRFYKQVVLKERHLSKEAFDRKFRMRKVETFKYYSENASLISLMASACIQVYEENN